MYGLIHAVFTIDRTDLYAWAILQEQEATHGLVPLDRNALPNLFESLQTACSTIALCIEFLSSPQGPDMPVTNADLSYQIYTEFWVKLKDYS